VARASDILMGAVKSTYRAAIRPVSGSGRVSGADALAVVAESLLSYSTSL
jgi:hypothetical protein